MTMGGIIASIMASNAGGSIEIVAFDAFNSSNPFNATAEHGSTFDDGDLIVVFQSNDAGNPSIPAGWNTLVSDSGGSPEHAIFWRSAVASMGTDIDAFSGQTDMSGVWVAIRGDWGTPTINAENNGSGSTYSWNAKTCAAGSICLASVHLDDDSISNGSWGNPSDASWTKVVGGGAVTSSSTYVAEKVSEGASENPGTLTVSSDAWSTYIVEVPLAA